MKRLALLISGLLLVIPILVASCTRELPPETVMVDSCVTCHTDKDTLQAVASPEPETATSEETTGEG
jgi:hypothetical protein